MATWRVYDKSGEEPVAVKQGFNWWAFIFVGLWALFKGLPVAGIVGLSITIGLMASGVDEVFAFIVAAALSITYGLKGNDWLSAKLERSGHILAATVEAASPIGALSAHRQPDLNE